MATMKEFIQLIKVQGADEAIRTMRELGVDTANLGKNTEEAGGKAQGAAGLFGEFSGELASLATGYIGVQKIAEAFQLLKQDLIETSEAAKEFAKSFRDLQFLSSEFNPRERAFVASSAAVAGRGMSETSQAFAQFKSKLPELSRQEQTQAFLEVAELGRTTDAPLESLVTAYSAIANVTGERDAGKIQNIIAKIKELAPETDLSAIGESIADPLAAGQAAGMSLAETLGLTEVIAKGVADQRKGATQARTFILSLAGKGTPEGEKTLERLGVKRGDGMMEALSALKGANDRGELSVEDVEGLFGREATAGGLAAITGVDQVRDFTAQFEEAASGKRDITSEMINKQLAGDETTRLTFAIATTDAQIEAEKVTGEHANDALAAELTRKRLELGSRQRGDSAVKRAIKGGFLESAQAFGMEDWSAMPGEEDASGYTIRDTVKAVREGEVTFDPQRGGMTVNVTSIGTNYSDNDPEATSPEYPDVGE